MNFKAFLILAFAICANIYGQIQTSISSNVRSFVDNCISSSLTRSSELIQGPIKVFDVDGSLSVRPSKLKDIEKSKSPANWKTRIFSKFVVKYPNIDGDTRAYYKSNIREVALSIESSEYDGNADAWIISIPAEQEKEMFRQNWFSKPTLSLDELKKIGIRHLRNNFKQFAGQLEYLNQEVEYELIDNENIITEVRLRFARRFHEGIVLGNIAYVYIVIDGRGNLKCAKIKWPVFEEAQTIANARTPVSTLDEVTSFCQSGDHLKVWGDPAVIQPKIANISGAARAWVPERVDGQIFISPAFSYSVFTTTAKGDLLSRYVNVPLSLEDKIDQSKYTNVTTAIDNGTNTEIYSQIAPLVDETPSTPIAPVIRNVRMK